MNHVIGIDLGGTNVKALAVTARGRVLAETVVPTGNTARPGWEKSVRRAVGELRSKTGQAPQCLGVAAPGIPATDQRSIAFMPGRLVGLEGLVWQEFFESPQPVPVLNDAQAALLGEVWRGAARGTRNAFLLTLGTGVGGAAMVDGHLLRGHLGRAGHLGHISLDPDGACDVASTPGSLEGAIGDCTLAERSGGGFSSTQALVAAVRLGDRAAQRVWQKSLEALAAGIASLVNVLDPEVVVLGGGIAQAGPTLFRPLSSLMSRFEWRPGGAKVRIVPARLGDRAGAFGAAWNALHLGETPS